MKLSEVFLWTCFTVSVGSVIPAAYVFYKVNFLEKDKEHGSRGRH